MIDPLTEDIVTLTEAARSECPHRRGGKPTHVSCLYRWTVSGCRGVTLESIQIGATRCTSRQALARFFEALTYAGSADRPTPRSPAKRQHAADQAIAALKAEGA